MSSEELRSSTEATAGNRQRVRCSRSLLGDSALVLFLHRRISPTRRHMDMRKVEGELARKHVRHCVSQVMLPDFERPSASGSSSGVAFG